MPNRQDHRELAVTGLWEGARPRLSEVQAPRNLGSLHRVAVVERNLGKLAIAAAGVEAGTLKTVAMRVTKGNLGTISPLPERGTLGTTVAETVQRSLHPGTTVAAIVATNNHHKQLMAANTITAAVNNRHNHIQLSSAGRMA